ncbi:hypothetical protein [Nocardia veterana]|uniref:Uncharacterized protein n=1 Tax=Nocardia veterana TaxID=132249 RepID=A0A7X6RL51_9NOCA|nr:hypothetical protein [Nocardia veterana]NKY89344.1 hypothetical protein [Nocardia veterana]
MVVTNLFAVIQTLFLAVWFGSMVYSVVVVQQFQFKAEDPEEIEEMGQMMADGSRQRIARLAIIAGISGVMAAITRAVHTPAPGGAWVALMIVKAVLFVVACAAFGFQSWWVWPKRIFARTEEMPGIRRTFFTLSLTMAVTLGAILAIDVVAQSL